MKPGAGRSRVGGRYGLDALVVAVTEPAVDGRATAAALKAVAAALGVSATGLRLVAGATSRTKLLEIPDSASSRFTELLEA